MSGAAAADRVYVYGIVPAGDASPSERARVVEHGPLAALVSTIPPDHTPGRREDLEAHQQVLSDAIQRGTAIPMRFGVVMDGDDAVRERLLARHERELAGLLQALDGQVQMTVKAFYVGDVLLREIVAAEPELARRSADLQAGPEAATHGARIELGRRIAGLVSARREADARALAERLQPVATDMVVEQRGDERLAFSAQLLVRRDRRPQLDEVVRAIGAEQEGRLALRYLGPLPPYSFADVALEEDAWA